MSDTVTRDFLVEQFRRVRGDIAGGNGRLDRPERRMGNVEEQVAKLVRRALNRERELPYSEARLRRVEARLDLREADG